MPLEIIKHTVCNTQNTDYNNNAVDDIKAILRYPCILKRTSFLMYVSPRAWNSWHIA